MLFKTAVCFALCCTFVLAQDNVTSQSFPPEPASNTTVKPSNHSTPSTTTTTSSTTTTTTTTAATPTKSTTTAATTTEPAPTLAPPTQGQYNVTNGTDICLRANLAVQVELHKEDAHFEFDIPNNAYYNGSSCNNDTQELKLQWEDEYGNGTLSFQFAKNNSKFMINLVTLSAVQQNSTFTSLISNATEFSTPLSKSYLCDKQQEIKLIEEGTNGTVYAVLKLSHVQLQAFFSSKEGKFGAVEDCSSSSSPDIVPIAVGCALVGLIAIVLIAYLVGRRRSQARGYLSM